MLASSETSFESLKTGASPSQAAGDPLNRERPEWTRERWDAALLELDPTRLPVFGLASGLGRSLSGLAPLLTRPACFNSLKVVVHGMSYFDVDLSTSFAVPIRWSSALGVTTTNQKKRWVRNLPSRWLVEPDAMRVACPVRRRLIGVILALMLPSYGRRAARVIPMFYPIRFCFREWGRQGL